MTKSAKLIKLNEDILNYKCSKIYDYLKKKCGSNNVDCKQYTNDSMACDIDNGSLEKIKKEFEKFLKKNKIKNINYVGKNGFLLMV